MARDNVAVVRRAVERIWNRGDLPLADHLFSATYVNHGGLIPDIVQGPEVIKVTITMYRLAFPGLSITIDRLEADAEMVECGWTAHALLHGVAVMADHRGLRELLGGPSPLRGIALHPT